MTSAERKRIMNETVRVLENEALSKEHLFERVAARIGLNASEIKDTRTDGKSYRVRAVFSSVLEGLVGRGLVTESDGRYALSAAKPVIIRAAACEKEILSMLTVRSMTKSEIRRALEQFFGTARTATKRDDNILFSYLGQILKRLVNERTLVLSDEKYSISEKKCASIDDMNSMLGLKTEFLDRLHSRGGEFFEHYFMSLIAKYLSKHGKTVSEAYVTGGSADGGIDGVIRTVDCLGFRETVMVQTKNRNTHTSETDVRSFYGAVCARMGSRGIYVTSSDFHPSAAVFLESIDNCVGVNGSKIFEMAVECSYGIKRRDGKYIIDEKVI